MDINVYVSSGLNYFINKSIFYYLFHNTTDKYIYGNMYPNRKMILILSQYHKRKKIFTYDVKKIIISSHKNNYIIIVDCEMYQR